MNNNYAVTYLHVSVAHLSEEPLRKLFPSMYRVLGFGTGAVMAKGEGNTS